MEIINLSNRKEVEVNINGNECIVSLSLKNINHFQESTKIGLTKAIDKMKKGDLNIILKLIYSKFKKYIFGQAIDSAILFIMIFISMTIFKIPYAIFISFILAICAAVPILGPLIGIIITTIIMIIAGYKNILFFILIVIIRISYIELNYKRSL